MDGWVEMGIGGFQNESRILLETFPDEVQVIEMCGNLKNLRKKLNIILTDEWMDG